MVMISGLLRFIQETRSNHSAEKLKEMVHTTATVARGKEGRKEIPLAEIVPGDIIFLAAGDMIPADVRVITCRPFCQSGFLNRRKRTRGKRYPCCDDRCKFLYRLWAVRNPWVYVAWAVFNLSHSSGI